MNKDLEQLQIYSERLALFQYRDRLTFHAFLLVARNNLQTQIQICESQGFDSAEINQRIRVGKLKGEARAMRPLSEDEVNEAKKDNEELARILELYLSVPISMDFDTEADSDNQGDNE